MLNKVFLILYFGLTTISCKSFWEANGSYDKEIYRISGNGIWTVKSPSEQRNNLPKKEKKTIPGMIEI